MSVIKMTMDEASRLGLVPKSRRGKYNATKVEFDGITFDSKAEWRRYVCLKDLQRRGKIASINVHKKWPCLVNGTVVTTWTSDFDYYELDDDGTVARYVVEDVKSKGTRLARDWPLRRRLVQAIYEIEISEVVI